MLRRTTLRVRHCKKVLGILEIALHTNAVNQWPGRSDRINSSRPLAIRVFSVFLFLKHTHTKKLCKIYLFLPKILNYAWEPLLRCFPQINYLTWTKPVFSVFSLCLGSNWDVSKPINNHTHWGHQKGKRHVYPNVHHSTVYNRQDMEAT